MKIRIHSYIPNFSIDSALTFPKMPIFLLTFLQTLPVCLWCFPRTDNFMTHPTVLCTYCFVVYCIGLFAFPQTVMNALVVTRTT